jgi:hypothetical protein
MTRFQSSFLLLIAIQTAHSVEEYVGRLYDVFPPARFLSGLVSQNRERGFLILNAALITFGLLCFLGPIRRQWPSAVAVAWIWAAIELVNGIGHPLWSLIQLRYTPGVVTAPLLLLVALYLARQLINGQATPSAAA